MTQDQDILKVFVSGGDTLVRHSPNSDHLYVCSNGILKIFDLNRPDNEPEVLDVVGDTQSIDVAGFSGSADLAAISSRTGECRLYDLAIPKEISTLYRSPLALQAAVFTHGGANVLCSGLDGKLCLIEAKTAAVKATTEPGDQVVALAYNGVGDLAAVSLAGGDLAVYSYTVAEPTLVVKLAKILVKKIGVSGSKSTGENSKPTGKKTMPDPLNAMGDDADDDDDLFDDDLDADISRARTGDDDSRLAGARADWSPNGDFLAVPLATREISVYDRNDFTTEKFKLLGISKPIVDLRWSPNGKMIASVDLDHKLIIWDITTHKSIQMVQLSVVPVSISWDRRSAGVVVGTTSGNIVRCAVSGTKKLKSNTGLVLDEAAESSGEESATEEPTGEGQETPGEAIHQIARKEQPSSPMSESSLFGEGEDDFIVDDDGAGYVEKKPKEGPAPKRRHIGSHHAETSSVPNVVASPYSPGCTPWAGGRRYLTINPFGYVWDVRQEGYDTITVTFFDRSLQKEYHFRDFHNLDLASMNSDSVLLGSSCHKATSESSEKPVVATVLFKKHDQSRSWERQITLKHGEFITCVSLGPSAAFVCSSLGYVRRYSLYGRLERLEKLPPVLACVSSSKYLFTVIYASPYSLSFNLQDLDGKYFQRSESLPIIAGLSGMHPIRGLFFSSDGDPCIVGQDNVVLVLSRWRDPLQACWIPLLDANEGLKQISVGNDVSAWPLGLFKDKLSFVAVRGTGYPSFPLALPSDMPVRLPVGDEGKKDSEDSSSPEEELMRTIVEAELLNDSITNDDVEDETAEERLAALSVRYDAALLKQIGESCNQGDILDAFYLTTKLRDERALAAAAKMAERLELAGLVEKINRLREARMQIEDAE